MKDYDWKWILAIMSIVLPFIIEFIYYATSTNHRPYEILYVPGLFAGLATLIILGRGRISPSIVVSVAVSCVIFAPFVILQVVLYARGVAPYLNIVEFCWGLVLALSALIGLYGETIIIERQENFLTEANNIGGKDKKRRENAVKISYESIKSYLQFLVLAFVLVTTTLGVCMTILWTGPEHCFKMDYTLRWFTAVLMVAAWLVSILWLVCLLFVPLMKMADSAKRSMIES